MQPSSETHQLQPPQIVSLHVEGMKCAGCVQAVEKQLTQQPGVLGASVNLVTQVATVECHANQADPQQLAAALSEAGFPSQAQTASSSEVTPTPTELASEPLSKTPLVWAASLVVLSVIGHLGHLGSVHIPSLSTIWFHWGLATLALFGPGREILMDGWRGLRRNAPNMNTLVSLGTLTAYTASLVALLVPQLGWECFFDEPVMLVGLILLGRTLEAQARNRATAAFKSLLNLQPPVARRLPQASLESQGAEVPVGQVPVGAWLKVLPGETFPVDGELLVGQTLVDESMLTGEAMPVVKEPGDGVTGGTLNQSASVVIQASRTGQETTLAQIIKLVETAQVRKAPIQRLADQVAGYFTYGVMAIATLTFLFWLLVGTHLWPDLAIAAVQGAHQDGAEPGVAHPLLLSLKLAIAVLVIACPCALGLATPTALLVGTSLGAERGLLIRGGDVLERVHQLDTVIFDKTGTLTTGQPMVTDCWLAEAPPADLTPTRLLQLAATVERDVNHPLAQAIQRQAHAQELPLLPVAEVHNEPGCGVCAQVEGQTMSLGTLNWLSRQGISVSEADQQRATALAATGKSLVYVAIANQFAGVLAVQDTLRQDAVATVAQLQAMGLRVMVLTGDQRQAAIAMTQPLTLPAANILAEVQPAAKAAVIAELQTQGHRVAMVGDGINDAPALAQADVGIALRSGTDVAVETAQIVLMRDWVQEGQSSLADVVAAIQLSRATFSKIQQNLFWAFIYNILGIPIAAGALLPSLGILLSPAAAGGLMAFSSVSVVSNSLLLRRQFASWLKPSN